MMLRLINRGCRIMGGPALAALLLSGSGAPRLHASGKAPGGPSKKGAGKAASSAVAGGVITSLLGRQRTLPGKARMGGYRVPAQARTRQQTDPGRTPGGPRWEIGTR